MIIKIPIPENVADEIGHAIEFDTDQIDRVQLSRPMAGTSRLTLDFAASEGAARWVTPDGT